MPCSIRHGAFILKAVGEAKSTLLGSLRVPKGGLPIPEMVLQMNLEVNLMYEGRGANGADERPLATMDLDVIGKTLLAEEPGIAVRAIERALSVVRIQMVQKLVV